MDGDERLGRGRGMCQEGGNTGGARHVEVGVEEGRRAMQQEGWKRRKEVPERGCKQRLGGTRDRGKAATEPRKGGVVAGDKRGAKDRRKWGTASHQRKVGQEQREGIMGEEQRRPTINEGGGKSKQERDWNDGGTHSPGLFVMQIRIRRCAANQLRD